MLGWEFPPFISGGLGTACFGLTRAMNEIGTQVLFVLPRSVPLGKATHVTLVTPPRSKDDPEGSRYKLDSLEHVIFQTVNASLFPYAQPAKKSPAADEEIPDGYDVTDAGEVRPRRGVRGVGGFVTALGPGEHYGGDMFAETERYAGMCTAIARNEEFDVIHAHDWMTYPAGIAIAGLTGKALVVHVHSTEFDRSGENVNHRIYHIERQGVHAAQRVIAVSHLTKNILVARYGVAPEKIEVVYNAIDEVNGGGTPPPITRDEKIVLFLGRITMQKGPEYFIAAAKKVLEVVSNVRFVMAGSGDMMRRMIELSAEMGIGHKVLFTGFLRGDDVARVFKMADLYVMPSVSEPFGIAPLEALAHDVPVIISKQSGVSEVLTHALKVDFWDVNEMANKIIAVLRHPPLQATLREHGQFEIRRLTWRDSAERCMHAYQDAIARRQPALV